MNESALFSPSAARQQQLVDREWRFVDSWLAPLYAPKPPPRFERNPDTLKALLALASTNENADEEESLSRKLKEEAVAAYKENGQYKIQDDPLLSPVHLALSQDATIALTSLSTSSVLLGVTSPTLPTLSRSIISQTRTESELDQHLLSITHLLQKLNLTLKSLQSSLEHYNSPEFQPSPDLPQSLSEHTRTIKMLTQKTAEYKDRCSSLEKRFPAGQVTIEDVLARKKEVEELEETVKEMEGRVKALKGLPVGNRELAELEVERARREVLELKERREAMFGGMVEK